MRLRFACLCALACGPAAAGPAEIVFLAPQNHAMPIARFEHGQLAGGILKDLGEAIAARLGVPARFVSVPSKRVALALHAHEADGVCYVLPDWIDGDYRWTQPIIPNGVAVVAHAGAPVVHALSDLAGRRVGTVLGYRYPPLEQALGKDFLRDDAASARLTFDKLRAGRVQYAVLEQMTIAYHLRAERLPGLRTDLVFETFKAGCAFAPGTRIPFKDIDRAVTALAGEGAVDAILARYR